MLKGKQLELLNINRELINTAAQKDLAETQKKNLDELISKNKNFICNLIKIQ